MQRQLLTLLRADAGICLDDSKRSRLGLTTSGRKRPKIANNIRPNKFPIKEKDGSSRYTHQVQWEKVFTNCFLRVDDKVGEKVNMDLCDDNIKTSSYTSEPNTVGSTAVVAVIYSSHIIVSNYGDLRAFLYHGKEGKIAVDALPYHSFTLYSFTSQAEKMSMPELKHLVARSFNGMDIVMAMTGLMFMVAMGFNAATRTLNLNVNFIIRKVKLTTVSLSQFRCASYMIIIMVPENYREFINTLASLVKGNIVSMSRIDHAVKRILGV
ncbi:Protein phosphatase 2C 16 [Capsicum baccatum]|uniref:Protein phosphatase 2C 16 n=1 Tax=Capsicum baccatum TaxID=33114 RepID=A0A2G2VFR9_CAPBA|nr:Protein phosphatase 2C 16 [Capsicum baccatum]